MRLRREWIGSAPFGRDWPSGRLRLRREWFDSLPLVAHVGDFGFSTELQVLRLAQDDKDLAGPL
jgi:hypothetical protein